MAKSSLALLWRAESNGFCSLAAALRPAALSCLQTVTELTGAWVICVRSLVTDAAVAGLEDVTERMA
jgi:hypothetical protein